MVELFLETPLELKLIILSFAVFGFALCWATKRDERNSFYAFAEFDVAKDCQICADSLENPESPELRGDEIVKLMCNHRFHKKCIEDFRAFGVNSVCNICRKKLPPSPEKQFDDG